MTDINNISNRTLIRLGITVALVLIAVVCIYRFVIVPIGDNAKQAGTQLQSKVIQPATKSAGAAVAQVPLTPTEADARAWIAANLPKNPAIGKITSVQRISKDGYAIEDGTPATNIEYLDYLEKQGNTIFYFQIYSMPPTWNGPPQGSKFLLYKSSNSDWTFRW